MSACTAQTANTLRCLSSIFSNTMNYTHVATNTPTPLDAIRAAHPHMSIPEGADLTKLGYTKLRSTPPPACASNERVVAGEPVLIDGESCESWHIEPLPAEEVIAAVTHAVQRRLDDFARTRMYDGILSAASYATSTLPNFAAEGQYAVEARDASWTTCYQIMGEVQQGLRDMPTVEQVLSELPTLEWPQ